MKSLPGGLFAWLLFLFAEYSTVAMAVFPPFNGWSYANLHAHLLLLLPGVVVAYWVFEPRLRGKQTPDLAPRLLIGALVLFAAAFLTLGVGEVAYRHHYAQP